MQNAIYFIIWFWPCMGIKMKIVHIADLHIGKIVNGFVMLEDQRFVLDQVLEILEEEKAEALILAGDIYDRAVPSASAVLLLDSFLTRVKKLGVYIFVIAGNHDSPERLGFAGALLKDNGLYIAGEWHGELERVELEDEYGKLFFYLMPFARLAVMNNSMGTSYAAYEECVKEVLNRNAPDTRERNILAAHHFVSGEGEPELCDSENILTVGGIDRISGYVFADFDYTALGHLHGPQWVVEGKVRYAGSLLKYSFSETFHKKSVTVVELKEKGNVKTWVRELKPLHDMRKIKGELKELIREDVAALADKEDYIHATLTNQEELFEPIFALRAVYPNVMQLILEKNKMDEDKLLLCSGTESLHVSIVDAFGEFYESVMQKDFDKEHRAVMEKILEEMEEEA